MGKSRALAAFHAGRVVTMRWFMVSGGKGRLEPYAYERAFPRVGDALTLYLCRTPAFHLARAARSAAVPAVVVTIAEALLSGLVFALFWRGHYWLGLFVALPVMLLSTVAMMLSRLGHAHGWANHSRVALEVTVPLLWWWAWAHGLIAYGRPLEPIFATMVLWVVLGGTIAIRAIEWLVLQRCNGMQIHSWRPVDSRFALASASRNTNLVILAAALLVRRPDSGLVLVAWWTLISLIFHAVRFAQLTERQARRHKITSWLDR
jgi:hypothetical protein